MNNTLLIHSLRERLSYLQKVISSKTAALARPQPEGRLRCSTNKGCNEYYLIINPKDRCGKYIRKDNRDLAASLAQKEYDEEILRRALAEQRSINHLLSKYDRIPIDTFYETLSPGRRHLVTPILLPDDEFARRWQNKAYDKPVIPDSIPPFYTARGERVRSKSEILIADSLNAQNIPYLYEFPLRLPGFGIIHPDFTILNVRLRIVFFWEHAGKLGDPGYCKRNLPRINHYMLNGIFPGDRLILTFESEDVPLDTRVIAEVIKHYLL